MTLHNLTAFQSAWGGLFAHYKSFAGYCRILCDIKEANSVLYPKTFQGRTVSNLSQV